MTALLLAGGVTAHVWVVVMFNCIAMAKERKEWNAGAKFVASWFIGLFACVYFWSRVGGLA